MPYKCKYSKECKYEAIYNYINNKPEYCKKHKCEDMINVKNKKCIFKDKNNIQCNKIPYFGLTDDKRPSYCDEHKLENMVDIKSRKCIFKDDDGNQCRTQPCYGFLKDKLPIYCNLHKLENMINIRKKKCIFKDKNGNQCNKQPNFGLKDDKIPSYCFEHKLDNMEDITTKKCIFKDKNGNQCAKQPNFGLKDDKNPTYCNEHKLDKMIDIKSPRCKSCNLYIVRNKNNLCSYCNPNSTKAQKLKEIEILNLLKETYKDKEIVHNKTIGLKCGNFRPDFVIDCISHNLIIEVDEDQHKSYPKDCEETRLHRIAEALHPCIIIRYNPDAYKVNGITKKTFKKTRHEKLLETVNKYIEVNVENYLFEVIYLFYDK